MKVLCNREKLREAFSVIQNVIPTKSTKPILQSVRIEAQKGKLEMSATDLEIGIRYLIDEVETEKPGVVVIPAKVAGDFIRDLNDESVTLIAEGTSCHIKGMSDSCELVGENPDDYPRVPEFDKKNALNIPSAELVDMVNRTSFAAAREMGRYAMHGVHFALGSDFMRMVATDGRRLALMEKGIEKGASQEVTAIIPTKGMIQFTKVIAEGEEHVDIHFSTSQVALKTGRAEVFVRLLEGEFPDYMKVIPRDCPNAVEASREGLLQKLQLVANLTGDNSRSVQWKIGQDAIGLTARSAGRGEAKAELEGTRKGAEAEIAFNPDYLIEGLKRSEAENITLEYSDRESPGKFLLGENQIYIVMPITVE